MTRTGNSAEQVPELLSIDVGNSSIGIGCWTSAGVELTRVSSPAAAAQVLLVDRQLPCRAVGIAVARQRWDELAERLEQQSGMPVEQGRREVRTGDARETIQLALLQGAPLDVADDRLLTTVGADRFAAALGAVSAGGEYALSAAPCVIVDAGTAVTVDVVDERGVFQGGFIGPGPGVASAGLKAAAPALPAHDGQPVPLVLGRETVGAVSAGAWGMAVGGVECLVRQALAHLSLTASPGGAETTEVRLVVTGGWGQAWLEASCHSSTGRWDAALVHRGIRAWADRDRSARTTDAG